jgi:hypothetical protein
MGAFEDIHRESVIGSLTMFDRLIFKGHLSRLYKPGRCGPICGIRAPP